MNYKKGILGYLEAEEIRGESKGRKRNKARKKRWERGRWELGEKDTYVTLLQLLRG